MDCNKTFAEYISLVTQKLSTEIMIGLVARIFASCINVVREIAKLDEGCILVVLITHVFKVKFPLILDHRSFQLV